MELLIVKEANERKLKEEKQCICREKAVAEEPSVSCALEDTSSRQGVGKAQPPIN